MHLGQYGIVAHTTCEIRFAKNTSAQVIAAVHEVADIRETVGADIGLGMSEDIGITCSCERVEDTSVTQVDDTVAGNRTQESATVHELTLGDVLRHVVCLRDTGYRAVQVDVSTVSCIVGVFQFACCFIIDTLSDGTFLAASEYLEHIAAVQVDGCRTPDLRIDTLTAAKHIQCLTQYVHSLLVEDNARVSLGNMIIFVVVKLSLSVFVALHLVEQNFTVNHRCVQVDDDITVHDTAVVATAIDVTAFQTTVDIVIITGDGL